MKYLVSRLTLKVFRQRKNLSNKIKYHGVCVKLFNRSFSIVTELIRFHIHSSHCHYFCEASKKLLNTKFKYFDMTRQENCALIYRLRSSRSSRYIATLVFRCKHCNQTAQISCGWFLIKLTPMALGYLAATMF